VTRDLAAEAQSIASMERWVSGSKCRSESIRSSNRSMRTGSSVPMGQTSNSEPRSANSPGPLTWLTLP